MLDTIARNAGLEDLLGLLNVQHDVKNDAVVAAPAIEMMSNGMLRIDGMGPDGPAKGADPGYFRCTDIFDEGLAAKLKIPLTYIRRLRSEYPALLASNVNAWLHGGEPDVGPDADPRKFMVRSFTDPDGGAGIARALLGNSYRAIDNLDVLTAALAGVRASGVEAHVEKAQLTDRRMHVDVVCPAIAANASTLLADYRNPFDRPDINAAGGWSLERARAAAAREGSGYEPGSEPMLWAGFTFANSETGNGKFSLAPRIVFSPCGNGLTLTRDMSTRVHVGGRLEEGTIDWSEATKAANLALVTSMVTDAVTAWLDIDFLRAQLDYFERNLADIADISEAVQLVGNELAYTEAERAAILQHFVAGGQLSNLGVMNAITSVAQTVESPDRAVELETSALKAFDLLGVV